MRDLVTSTSHSSRLVTNYQFVRSHAEAMKIIKERRDYINGLDLESIDF